jgi:hypothetical protein
MKFRYFIDSEANRIKALYPLTFTEFMAHFFTIYTCAIDIN